MICTCSQSWYEVMFLVAKSKLGLAPKYISDLMYKPLSARSSRRLLSADCCDLLVHVTQSRTSLSQNRGFAVTVVGPTLWNATPPALRSVILQGIPPASLRSLKTARFTCLSHWERLWIASCEWHYMNKNITYHQSINKVFVYWRKSPFWHRRRRGVQQNFNLKNRNSKYVSLEIKKNMDSTTINREPHIKISIQSSCCP